MESWLLREKGLGCVEELDKQTKKVNSESECNTSRNRVEGEAKETKGVETSSMGDVAAAW